MLIFKCKMCDGDVHTKPEQTYGSCGGTATMPKASDEKLVNLFNRANHFRRLNDFDKAHSAYEGILDEDNSNAEAHWGVVLSRFGIEYVEDPVTHERNPLVTVYNRSRFSLTRYWTPTCYPCYI